MRRYRRYSWRWLLTDETAGGSSPTPPTVIPAPAPPNYQQTAEEVAKSQLTYNPQLAAQNVQIQGTQGPILAQQQYDLASQYGPMYRALIEQQFPQIGMLSNQVSQRMASPGSLTVEQQAAQDAIRQRAYQQSEQGIRESANLGGTLFGGRRELREDRARNELAQGFATQDIQLQQQQRQQAMSELATLFQLAFPNVQQPGQVGLNTGVSDPTNALYDALVTNAGNFGIIDPVAGSPSPAWGVAGSAAGGIGTGIAMGKMMILCLPGTTLIDTPDGMTPIADIEAGDVVAEGVILFKNSYAPDVTTFVKLVLSDGRWVETCDVHKVEGRSAMTYQIGDSLGGDVITDKRVTIRTERTYDLLTNRPDGGYASHGIQVATMIPTLHRVAKLIEAL